jgi:peptide/nickel transport system substrate-binding protein
MANRHDRELIKIVESFTAGEMDRRSLVKRMSGLGAGAIFGGPLAALALKRDAGAAPAGKLGARPTRFQDPAPVKGGTVIAAQIDKPVNMDPAFAELYSSMQVYQNIFSTLVYVDANYNYTPGLAKSWTQVDPQTWEFELVDNATFHNGEKFTSADVAFTFERIFDPALAAPNAVFLQAIDSVSTDGDYKVTFKLKTPWGSFLADLAAVFNVVNEKGISSGDPRLNPVGTGPFKLTEWVQDDHITLDRWENYHVPDRPYLDKVIFKAISDDTVRLTGLQTDELQWAMQVPLQKVDELKSEGGDIKVTDGKPYLPDFIYLNASKPPFNDVRVRQAVAWCVNRSEVVQVAFFGQAEEATEAIYSGNPLYTGLNPWADGPDPEKAKALLAEAGIENLSFQLDGQPQVPTQIKAIQVLQQQLKSAGIETTIQNYDSSEWIGRLFGKQYDATISYWSATLDPVHFYYPGLLSTSGWNVTGYGTPEMDAALNTFAQATDAEARKAAYKALIEKFNEEVPMIPLDNQLQQYWVRANVYGMEPLPTMEIRFEPVYVAE